MNQIPIELVTYHPALASLAVLCLVVLLQSFLTAPLAFLKEEQTPGMPLNGDHSLLSFRALRAYLNSVENLPAFAAAVLLAVLINASPSWVNCLAVIHVFLDSHSEHVITAVSVKSRAGRERFFMLEAYSQT